MYGFLSSLAPSFAWLLLLRGLVGFAIGCVPQSVTLYAEFLPTKQRAKCVVLLDVSLSHRIRETNFIFYDFFFYTILQCFWALGACFEVALALAVAPTLGWRWLLGLSSAPLFIFACITPVIVLFIHSFIHLFYHTKHMLIVLSFIQNAVVARISQISYIVRKIG